jgi:hypothetical protein
METIVKTRDNKGNKAVDILTKRQIRNRVGEGWAIIEDPEWNGSIFLKGKLLYHSLNKSEVVEEFCKRKEKHLYFMHCIKPDPNVIYLL